MTEEKKWSQCFQGLIFSKNKPQLKKKTGRRRTDKKLTKKTG